MSPEEPGVLEGMTSPPLVVLAMGHLQEGGQTCQNSSTGSVLCEGCCSICEPGNTGAGSLAFAGPLAGSQSPRRAALVDVRLAGNLWAESY